MADFAIENLQWVLEQPLSVKELVKATSNVDLNNLPQPLKGSFSILSNRLSDWKKCADQVSTLTSQLDEAELKSKLANHLAEQYQSQLSKPAEIENLRELLSQAQTLRQLQNKTPSPIAVDTWHQKKECLTTTQQILLDHLKVIAKNDIVERFHRLPMIIVNLLTYGIHTTRHDTVEKVGNLLKIHQDKLKQHKKNQKTLQQLTVLLPLHEKHSILVDKINTLRKKLRNNAEESNCTNGKLAVLQPIVDQYPIAFEQEKAYFGTIAGANQYFSGLVSTALMKCQLVDKSYLSFRMVQKSLREYLCLTQKKIQLKKVREEVLIVIHRLEEQLEKLQSELILKGVNDFSSYGLLDETRRKLQVIDPDFNYSHTDILLVKQRFDFLRTATPKYIKQLELIIPELQSLKEELAQIRDLHKHYDITATSEELSQSYPWKSPLTLTLSETTTLLSPISTSIEGLEALCGYERDLQKVRDNFKNNEESCQKLQHELTKKQNQLISLEQAVNDAFTASQTAMRKAKEKKKSDANHSEQDNPPLTSTNLWKDFLNPLIVKQTDDWKTWLIDCCKRDKKEPLSSQQQLQFEQLCRDIYTELKYANDEDNTVLSAYRDMFNKPHGLKKLLSLKPAISIDNQNKYSPINNKELSQSLNQFKQLAQQEKGKIADIIEQIYNQLHYLAWQGEQKGIKADLIEALKHQFINDPRYQCLQQSKHYESIIDWLHGIFQAIKQLFVRTENPIFHYGLFSKQPTYLENAISISQAIAVCA